MRVCIIANASESDPGLLATGIEWGDSRVVILERQDPRSWKEPGNVDLFLHLGSSWSVYWESVRTNVDAEVSLMRTSVSHGVPVLGICFGAQVLSHAFGGVVARGKKTEIGWHTVSSVDQVPELSGRWLQWHYDSFSSPPGFDTLAFNDAGVQAIRRGRSLGVQFHPEANEAIVTRWMEGDGAAELAAYGLSPQELLDETRREVMRTEKATTELVRWFLETVAQSPFLAS